VRHAFLVGGTPWPGSLRWRIEREGCLCRELSFQGKGQARSGFGKAGWHKKPSGSENPSSSGTQQASSRLNRVVMGSTRGVGRLACWSAIPNSLLQMVPEMRTGHASAAGQRDECNDAGTRTRPRLSTNLEFRGTEPDLLFVRAASPRGIAAYLKDVLVFHMDAECRTILRTIALSGESNPTAYFAKADHPIFAPLLVWQDDVKAQLEALTNAAPERVKDLVVALAAAVGPSLAQIAEAAPGEPLGALQALQTLALRCAKFLPLSATADETPDAFDALQAPFVSSLRTVLSFITEDRLQRYALATAVIFECLLRIQDLPFFRASNALDELAVVDTTLKDHLLAVEAAKADEERRRAEAEEARQKEAEQPAERAAAALIQRKIILAELKATCKRLADGSTDARRTYCSPPPCLFSQALSQFTRGPSRTGSPEASLKRVSERCAPGQAWRLTSPRAPRKGCGSATFTWPVPSWSRPPARRKKSLSTRPAPCWSR
jgi:hypothetical protein